MYRVVRNFRDLQDKEYLYKKGDPYPREGYDPTKDRIEYLLGYVDSLDGPGIEMVVEEQEETTEEVEEVKKMDDGLEDKTINELKKMLDKKEIKYQTNAKKEALINLLGGVKDVNPSSGKTSF